MQRAAIKGGTWCIAARKDVLESEGGHDPDQPGEIELIPMRGELIAGAIALEPVGVRV